MASNKKINNACLKIFQFLKLLYENKAYYSDVVAIFRDEIEDQSNNNIQVTINKYINALKIFGLKVEKYKDKYRLSNSLYSMQFTLDDLKAISLLINTAKKLPNEKLQSDLMDFTEEIELRMTNNDRNSLKKLLTDSCYDFSFYYTNTKEQIEKCEKICKDGYLINVLYLKNGKETWLKSCTPKEVIYETKNVYLSVVSTTLHQSFEIAISNILSIAVEPITGRDVMPNNTVVFKIKNRMAKTYKLKENEYLQGKDSDGNLIVVNKNEPYDKLIKRLLRYSYNCEIISPQNLRREMLDLIESTMDNYS